MVGNPGTSATYPAVLTYKQAAVVQPFANTLVNMQLTSAQIKAALEQQWQPAGSARPFLRLGISEGFTYTYDPNAGPATENCSGSSFAENGGRDRHWVPHFLPGQNSGIGEFLKTQSWIPFEPIRGGVKTIYPEYRSVLSKTATLNTLTVPVSKSANDVAKQIAAQSPRDGRRSRSRRAGTRGSSPSSARRR